MEVIECLYLGDDRTQLQNEIINRQKNYNKENLKLVIFPEVIYLYQKRELQVMGNIFYLLKKELLFQVFLYSQLLLRFIKILIDIA